MNVDVLFFGQLSDLTGIREEVVSVEGEAQLKDLIQLLGTKYGGKFDEEMGRVQELRILINGREYGLLGGMEAQLKDKDTVVLLPPLGGG